MLFLCTSHGLISYCLEWVSIAAYTFFSSKLEIWNLSGVIWRWYRGDVWIQAGWAMQQQRLQILDKYLSSCFLDNLKFSQLINHARYCQKYKEVLKVKKKNPKFSQSLCLFNYVNSVVGRRNMPSSTRKIWLKSLHHHFVVFWLQTICVSVFCFCLSLPIIWIF